jgi:hypothetical protein
MFYLAAINLHQDLEIPEECPELYNTLREASEAMNESYQDSYHAYTSGNLASLDFDLCAVATPFDKKELAFIYQCGWHEAFLGNPCRLEVFKDLTKARSEFTEEEFSGKIFAVLNHLASSLPILRP